MRIYKARIKKTQYNIYTVYSDIDGANVYFDNEFYGIIIDGLCYIRVDKTLDTLTHEVRLQDGNVPDTVVKYTFTGATYSVSANADNSFDLQPAASYKDTTVYNYNSDTYNLDFETSPEVTINSKPVTTRTQLSWTPTTYNISENFTESSKTFKQTLTQAESGKTCVITINQVAGVEYSYTVHSDIEGATVYANNEEVGVIEDGVCVFTKWNTHAAESYPIKFEGGTLVPKANEYKLSNSTVPAVSQLGATLDLDQYITSTVRAYTPYSPTGSVTKDGSVTLNTKYNYKDSDTAYTISGDLVFDENQTTNKITRTFAVTQTASGKKINITVTQNAGVKYTYTIKSDIEGPTVKFGSETVGTITDGQLIVTKWNNHAATSYTVSLSGGTMPKKATQYGLKNTLPSTTVPATGRTYNKFIEETTIIYTSVMPANASCNRNSSVTMNTTYTETEIVNTVGSYTVPENQTTNTKKYTYNYTHSKDNTNKITVTFNQQAGVKYTYTVNSNIAGSKVTYSNGSTGTISGGKHVLTLWNNHAPASLTFTLSGGTVSEPDNWVYEFDVTSLGTTSLGSNDTYSASGQGESKLSTAATSRKRRYEYKVPTTTFTVNRNSSVTANETKAYTSWSYVTYSITAKSQSWITNSGNVVTIARNPNTTTRSGTITYTQAESGKTDVITINQANNNVIEIQKANVVAGDICAFDGTNKRFFRFVDSGATDDIKKYTPIGVVVIPTSHDVYGTGECGVISLKEMSCDSPNTGFTSYIGIYWGGYSTDISQLPNLNQVCHVGNYDNLTETVQGTTGNAHLPSDKFTTLDNPYDLGTGYYYNNNHYHIPSPYKLDGSFNTEYSRTSSPSSSANALADFDGIGNSEILWGLANSQSDWKTASSITNNSGAGYYPAACCCWRYHTYGTKQGDWYLPACGELGYIIPRFNKINKTITNLRNVYSILIGVTLLTNDRYWSSSEYRSNDARRVSTYDGYVDDYSKRNNLYTRAFLRV